MPNDLSTEYDRMLEKETPKEPDGNDIFLASKRVESILQKYLTEKGEELEAEQIVELYEDWKLLASCINYYETLDYIAHSMFYPEHEEVVKH